MTNYNSSSSITKIDEVVRFFDYLVNERDCDLHPDDDFSEYIDYTNGEPCFTVEEVTLYNRLMDESVVVCEKNRADIYEIGMNVVKASLRPSA